MKRAGLATAILLCVVVLLRYSEHLSGDATIVKHDWYSMHQVDACHAQRAMDEGALLPTWSPWILGGAPLFAVSTKPFSYPPFVLAVKLCAPPLAMNVLLLLHLCLGSIGTALLARRLGLLGIAPAACGLLFVLVRFPAMAFEASPFGFGFAIAWWPFALLALIDLLEARKGWRAAAWLGVTLALQWHAGGEPALYWLACFALPFGLPYLLRPWKAVELRALVVNCALALAVLFGLVAVKLLPELEWLRSSGRALPLGVELTRDSAVEQAVGSSSHLLTLARLLADEYGGAGAWTLALGASLGAFVARNRRAWSAVLAGSVACYVLASGALHDQAYEWLPGYDRMRRHSRFVNAFGFGAILLAGHGLQLRLADSRKLVRYGLPALLLILLLADTRSLPLLQLRAREFGSSSAELERTRRQLAPILADTRLGRYHPPTHRAQPAWVELGIESSGGALGGPRSGNARFTQLLGEFRSAKELEDQVPGVLDALNVRYTGSRTRLEHAHLERLSEEGDEADGPPLILHERRKARARASIVHAPTWIHGEPRARRARVVAQLRSPEHDARTTVLVEHPGRAPDEGGAPTRIAALDDARITKRMSTIEVDVTGHGGAYLLLAELAAISPGWTARVDGEPTPLFCADGVVTLLALPEGARRVRLEYKVPGLLAGAWISALTLLALLAASCVAALRRIGARQAG